MQFQSNFVYNNLNWLIYISVSLITDRVYLNVLERAPKLDFVFTAIVFLFQVRVPTNHRTVSLFTMFAILVGVVQTPQNPAAPNYL